MSDIVLHGYWRSSASYRVRIALNLKGLSYRQVTHDLRQGEQRSESYRKIAPHGLVPALEYGDTTLIESPAIIEWIDARWSEPPLIPQNMEAAAIVRAMAALIACDTHPLNNLRVLKALKSDFQASEDQVQAWIARWTSEGFAALEGIIARHGNGYCFGDRPTIADCYLVPQIYNARRFGVDLTPYPHILSADQAMETLVPVRDAHPDRQPDADIT